MVALCCVRTVIWLHPINGVYVDIHVDIGGYLILSERPPLKSSFDIHPFECQASSKMC